MSSLTTLSLAIVSITLVVYSFMFIPSLIQDVYGMSVTRTTNIGLTGSVVSSVGFDSSTSEIYVATTDYRLRVLDPSTMDVKETMILDSYPVYIAKNPSTGTVYLSMHYTDTVTVVDAIGKTVLTTIDGLSDPFGIGVNPTTNTIYVANMGSKELSIINGATNKIEGAVKLGNKFPTYVAVNPATNMIYVTAVSWSGDTLHIIDGTTNSLVESIEVGKAPAGVAVNSQTNKVYVANFRSHTISVIDGSTNQIIKNIPVASFPYRLIVDEQTDRVFATNFHSGVISVIDGTSDTVIETVPVGQKPMHLVLNPDTKDVYISDWRTEKIHSVAGRGTNP